MLLRCGTVAGAIALVAVFVWIASSRGYLTGRELFGGTAGFLALLALASAVADRSFRFEPSRGRVLWTVRRLFRSRYGEVAFGDVLHVSLRETVDTDERPHRVSYQPILETTAGSLPLSSFHASNAAESEALARAICTAMNRTYEPPREATIEELVAAGRIVDAVKRVRREAEARAREIGLAEARGIVDEVRARLAEESSSERRAA